MKTLLATSLMILPPAAVAADQVPGGPTAVLVLKEVATSADAESPGVKATNWSFQGYLSASLGDADDEIRAARIGVGRYLLDDLSLNFEVVLGSFDATVKDGVPGGDGFVGGADVLLRWFFREGEKLSAYVDGGVGVVRFDAPFPSVATRTNFEPQVGVGLLWRMSEDLFLMAGVRYQHVSNAGYFGAGRNPGFDAAMPYVGLLGRF